MIKNQETQIKELKSLVRILLNQIERIEELKGKSTQTKGFLNKTETNQIEASKLELKEKVKKFNDLVHEVINEFKEDIENVKTAVKHLKESVTKKETTNDGKRVRFVLPLQPKDETKSWVPTCQSHSEWGDCSLKQAGKC